MQLQGFFKRNAFFNLSCCYQFFCNVVEKIFIWRLTHFPQIHGQTTGWVGIGISPSGSMVDADMYVGWVKNGNANITVWRWIPQITTFTTHSF